MLQNWVHSNFLYIFILFFIKATSYLWKYLDVNQSDDKLLRVVTCLANIVCHSGMMMIPSSASITTAATSTAAPSPPTTHDKSSCVSNGASLISQQYVKIWDGVVYDFFCLFLRGKFEKRNAAIQKIFWSHSKHVE